MRHPHHPLLRLLVLALVPVPLSTVVVTLSSAGDAHARKGEPATQRLERQRQHRVRMQYPLPRPLMGLLRKLSPGGVLTREREDMARELLIDRAREEKAQRRIDGVLHRKLGSPDLPRVIRRRIGRLYARAGELGLKPSSAYRQRYADGRVHLTVGFDGPGKDGVHLGRRIGLSYGGAEGPQILLEATGWHSKTQPQNSGIQIDHGISTHIVRQPDGRWTEEVYRKGGRGLFTVRAAGAHEIDLVTGARATRP